MNSFNRGEWSEFYGVLFLLVKPNVQLVDSALKNINQLIYIVKKVILDSKIKLEYVISQNGDILVYADNKQINCMSKEVLDRERNKLLNSILSHTEKKGAFSIPSSEEFVSSMTNNCSFKSKSKNKSDIVTISFDTLKSTNVSLNYSIKSSLGSPATILNASNNTDFKYKVNNFPLDKIASVNSIETRTKLLDRIRKIKSYSGVTITFENVVSSTFEYNLKMIDSLLPQYLGNTLLYSYEYDDKDLKSIFKLANPTLSQLMAEKKLGDFLNGISFGFVPGSIWNGINSVNGGLIIVKNNGDVVVLDLMYYPQEVAKFIMNESKLDSPSTHRYHMLELYEENGEVFFTLNLQVRYKK